MKRFLSLMMIFVFVFNSTFVFMREAKAIPIIAYGGWMLVTRIMAMSAARYAGHSAARYAGASAYQAATARYMISRAAYSSTYEHVGGAAAGSLFRTALGLGVSTYALNELDSLLRYSEDGYPESTEVQYGIPQNGRSTRGLEILARTVRMPWDGSVKPVPLPVFEPTGLSIASNFTKEVIDLPPIFTNAFVADIYSQCFSIYGFECARVANISSTFKYVSPIIRTYTPFGYVNPQLIPGSVGGIESYSSLVVGCVDPIDCAKNVAQLAGANVSSLLPSRDISALLDQKFYPI